MKLEEITNIDERYNKGEDNEVKIDAFELNSNKNP
jgi:hypothetical protein